MRKKELELLTGQDWPLVNEVLHSQRMSYRITAKLYRHLGRPYFEKVRDFEIKNKEKS